MGTAEAGGSLGLVISQPSFVLVCENLSQGKKRIRVTKPATIFFWPPRMDIGMCIVYKCFSMPSHLNGLSKCLVKRAGMEKLVSSLWECSDPVLGTHSQIRTRRKEKKSNKSAAQGQFNSESTEAWLSLELGPVGLGMRRKESRTESVLPQPRGWARSEDNEGDSPVDIRERRVSEATKVGKDAGEGRLDGPGSKAECLVWTNNSGPGQWWSWNLL